jgi:hypothetical protein
MDEGRCSYNAVLSPDGSFVISCESSIDNTVNDDNASGKTELMLYDISNGDKASLYSSDRMFGASSPLNGGHEAIYITKSGRLLVWFIDGYRLFQLK